MQKCSHPAAIFGQLKESEQLAAAPNTAVKAAPFGCWTLRDKAPRSAPYLQR